MEVRCVGSWATQKLIRLTKYLGIFATGMREKWDGLNYLEICCGPGRCIVKESGLEIDGTSLAVIRSAAFDYIGHGCFIDSDPRAVAALNSRVDSLGQGAKARALVASFTDPTQLQGVLRYLPDRCLNFALIDPSDCSVPFATLKSIKDCLKNLDLLLNIAIGTDVVRNIRNAILDDAYRRVREKYSAFLGSDAFFQDPRIVRKAEAKAADDDMKRAFIEEYLTRIRTLGYAHTDLRKVKHYYYLLFASSSAKGIEFWKKANRIEPDSQYMLEGIP